MKNQCDIYKQKLLDFYVYILLGPSIFLWHFLDRNKIIYLLPFIFVVLVVTYNLVLAKSNSDKIHFKTRYIFVIIGYILICFLSIAFNLNSNIFISGIQRDMLIFLTPLIIYGYDLKYRFNHIIYLFFVAICSYFAIVGIDTNFDIHLSLFETSGASNEFHAGILFGLFLLTFVLYKKKYLIFFSILFILLASKRAIFLGLIPSFGLYYFIIKPFRLMEQNNKWLLFILTFSFYFILYPISINLEDFSSWALNIISNGEYSTVDFLMKREVFVDILNAEIFTNNYVDFLFGHGPGQADIFLQNGGLPGFMKYLLKNPINPHNEFCKLHYDLGLIGVLFYFIIIYTMYINGTKVGVLIFLFTIPTFLVDNPLIFIYYSHIANLIVNTDFNNE